MSLFFSLLPLYLLGNLHCMGMCGPLVMTIGSHPYRHLYFLGRLLSFTMAGGLAGAAGAVLNAVLKQYHIAEATSFLFGGIILLMGLCLLTGTTHYPGYQWLSRRLHRTTTLLSVLILQEKAWPTFFFGFFTLLLPCGQTLIVFSACALAGDVGVGLFNGAAFALLTSPALLLSMQAKHFLKGVRGHYSILMGTCALIVGFLAIARGLAELEVIPHCVLCEKYHIVLY